VEKPGVDFSVSSEVRAAFTPPSKRFCRLLRLALPAESPLGSPPLDTSPRPWPSELFKKALVMLFEQRKSRANGIFVLESVLTAASIV
jgi:hypothetical protein